MEGHTSVWSTQVSHVHLLRDFTYVIGLESLLISGAGFVAGQVLLHICRGSHRSISEGGT
jgi:hypothetical protein